MKDATPETGMSRAAKKRAKKRQKKQKHRDETEKQQEADETKITAIKKQKTTLQHEPSVLKTPPDTSKESLVSSLSPAQILMLQETQDEDHRDALQSMSSSSRARCLMNSLLLNNTMTAAEFYTKYWEKQPLYIPSASNQRFNFLMSLNGIRELFQTKNLRYGRDVNVTNYQQTSDDHVDVKRRVTLDLVSNQDGEFITAKAQDVWSNYDSGCTLRLLCPQKFFGDIHSMLSLLELEWGCMVGANAYLTPPGANNDQDQSSSQGFAPHYDDIEAFVLQLEGRKHWKVYAPRNRQETLPRTSSVDFVESDLASSDPYLDVVLEPGDVLYMPRGWIHQACSTAREHSLHLTVSAMQTWAWADLMEILVPQALEAATSTSVSMRQGLPHNFLNYMGAIHDDNSEELPEGLKQLAKAEKQENGNAASEEQAQNREKKQMRDQFREEAKARVMKVCKEAMSLIDAGCDQIGKRFLSDRLPPALTASEKSLTSGSQSTQQKLWPNTLVRLVRPGIARLALEDGKAVLYHCMDNSCVYHGNPLSPMEFEMDDAPALEALLTTVEPHWICVHDLIHDDIKDKVEIAQALYDEGILAIMQAS